MATLRYPIKTDIRLKRDLAQFRDGAESRLIELERKCELIMYKLDKLTDAINELVGILKEFEKRPTKRTLPSSYPIIYEHTKEVRRE